MNVDCLYLPPCGACRGIEVKKFPSDQSLASRSAEKFEGKPGNGSPKPDGIKNAGSVLSPEICIVVVIG